MKRGKKLIPKKLHAELSDYASLMRALRTEAAQQSSSQLVLTSSPSFRSHSRPFTDDENEISNQISEGDEYIPEPSEDMGQGDSVHIQGVISSSHKRTHSEENTQPRKRRKTHFDSSSLPSKSSTPHPSTLSARWPQLEEDTFVPEWTLRDEVASLAKAYLRTQIPQPSNSGIGEEPEEERSDEDDDEDEFLHKNDNTSSEEHVDRHIPTAYVDTLTDQVSLLLEHVFSMIASNRPAVAASMQNRLAPMNWESVLNIVTPSEMIPSNVTRTVRKRLERFYGIDELAASPEPLEKSKKDIQDLEAELLFGGKHNNNDQDALDMLLRQHFVPKRGSRKVKRRTARSTSNPTAKKDRVVEDDP